jgi:hypothetical protein
MVIEGIAAEDTPGPFESSPHGTVFPYGFDKILAARRTESAFGSQHWADPNLIAPHQQDHRLAGKVDQESKSGSHLEIVEIPSSLGKSAESCGIVTEVVNGFR